MYGGVWRHWWFWVAVPLALLGFRYLDAGLSSYCQRYWSARGEEPPPRRHSYRLDAASVVVYTAGILVLAVALAFEHKYLWAGLAAIACCALGWFAVIRARANVIGFGWSRSGNDD